VKAILGENSILSTLKEGRKNKGRTIPDPPLLFDD
jgi:hypothetical protein